MPEIKDIPEEGFVPYVTEAETDTKANRKHRLTLLIPVFILVIVLAIAIFLLMIPRFNRYQKVMKRISFEYQNEIPGNEDTENAGKHALTIAKELGSQPVRVNAVCYLLDDNNRKDNTVSEYEYLSSQGLVQLKTIISAKKAYKSSVKEIRTRGNGYEYLDGDDWKPSEKEYIPDFRDYFFGIVSHDNVTIGCYNTYQTTVNGKPYLCEVWLMDEQIGNHTAYSTIYRYYDGQRLAGVIILHDADQIKEVYEITSYEINPKL